MKIYFDMDGVLADFDRGVIEILHMTPRKQENANKKMDDELFEAIKNAGDFFADLKPIDGMVDLFNELYDQYGSDIEILTGIPNEKRMITNAKSNKVNWIRKYLNDEVVVNTVRRKDKPNYVIGKDSILIDDFKVNIKEWEKAGGTAILFENADKLRKDLKKVLEELL